MMKNSVHELRFSFGPSKFEMHMRQPSKDVRKAIGCIIKFGEGCEMKI